MSQQPLPLMRPSKVQRAKRGLLMIRASLFLNKSIKCVGIGWDKTNGAVGMLQYKHWITNWSMSNPFVV